ncbi:class I SAM-dependent methyltransferase [Halosimplex aquaticum]
MPPEDDHPISRSTYDELAPGYEDITDAAIREHYEWPTVEQLLPPLEDRRVLDAACGDGFYTERLAEAGADPVGVDASPAMVRRARERFDGAGSADEIPIHEADLTDGLAFLDDAAFDLVLCQLALEHVRDWGRSSRRSLASCDREATSSSRRAIRSGTTSTRSSSSATTSSPRALRTAISNGSTATGAMRTTRSSSRSTAVRSRRSSNRRPTPDCWSSESASPR